MSRHSSGSAQELVRANQELRSKVSDLQEKLAKSEAAIKTAIAAATDGYHHGGSNLSVTTHPSTILSLAESIASIGSFSPSPTKGSRGGVDAHTPPLAGTNTDRIDRLVVSNRELRHAITDKDAKIGKAMQEVESLKQQAKAQESKIVSLYEDLEKAEKALQDAHDDAQELVLQPARWELDKARLVAAQNKERDHMIELLNRERSDKDDLRVGYEEALQRALTTQAQEAAAVLETAQIAHAQELQALHIAHAQELQALHIAHAQELQALHIAHAQELQAVEDARELEKQQSQLEITP